MIIYIKKLNILRTILLKREIIVKGYKGMLCEMREAILRICDLANFLRIA
jgi:hypothetical protein